MTTLKKHGAVTAESRALIIGSAGFFILGVMAFVLVGREPVALSGRGSAGDIAPLGTAVLGAAAVVAGSLQRRGPESNQPPAGGGTRNDIDTAALALAHACIFLLGWLALFSIFQRAFVRAVLYPLAAAILVGVTGAISAYIAYLSAVTMNAYRLAALLAVFLVTGVLTTMLTAEDPLSWQENLSALGTSSDVSGAAFNITLIVAGVVVTTLAGYSTRTLESTADAARSRRRVRQLEGGIILIGILLACMGLFRVGYYNLTAVELIAASLVFAWLIVLSRSGAPSPPATLLHPDQTGPDS